MAEPNYLTWNLPNWITVVLMAAIGMAIVGMVVSLVRTATPQAQS